MLWLMRPGLTEAAAGARADALIAAAALASLQAPESVDGLVAALGEEDPQVRRDAAFALGRIGDPATASVLSDALAGELSEQAGKWSKAPVSP